MLRSLVAAFVALAASASAFTVSPLASHCNGAAVAHAGRMAPLSMAENNADKIRYVLFFWTGGYAHYGLMVYVCFVWRMLCVP